MIDTASRDFIAALGGSGVVAAHLGLRLNRVGNWGKRGIPWQFRPAIAEMAKERRIKVPANFLRPHAEAA